MLGVDFDFPCNLFYFRTRPSWSSLQVQLNLIISFRYSARRLRGVYLCLIMVSSPTSAKIADATLWDLGAWRAPTVIAVWNIFKNSKWIKKINFSMNYYWNVSLISSSTKNDRCQDVTNEINKSHSWFETSTFAWMYMYIQVQMYKCKYKCTSSWRFTHWLTQTRTARKHTSNWELQHKL